MRDPLALVPVASAPLVRPTTPPPARVALWATGIASATLLSIMAHSSMIAFVVLVVCAVATFAVGTVASSSAVGQTRVDPDDVESLEVRALYSAVLVAQGEVERAARAAPGSHTQLARVLERSRTIATLAGRVALLANPVHRFLATHDRQLTIADAERLRARAASTTDPRTQAALDHAVAARSRQIATHDQLIAKRDEVLARLELARTALESFVPMIVKLQIIDDESTETPDELASDVDEIGGDLDALASAQQTDAAP